MKLLAKYNRVNIAATVIVFVISGLCYYFILHYVLLAQLDKDLQVEEQEVLDFIKDNNKLPATINYTGQKIYFEPTGLPVARKLSSIEILDTAENEFVTTRQLVFPLQFSGSHYKAVVSKSQQETEDMVELIVSITLAMVILLLLVLFIINRFVLNKLWNPFNDTLNQLKQFNLNSKAAINPAKSNIREFNELNDAVMQMSNRVLQDYEVLKDFTENASHEIQTPLAIVNSKLELLMQSENFTEGQMKDIETVHGEIRRLSKLNQALLLLTKIDNRQFIEKKEMDIAALIATQLNNYEELMTAKQISLTKNMNEPLKVLMNETIAGVLVSNLVTNAIKHNVERGSIHINLQENRLQIQNTGAALQYNPDELFERFKKDKPQSESLGLGLSIIKKICDQYGFSVDYAFNNGLHTITVQFI